MLASPEVSRHSDELALLGHYRIVLELLSKRYPASPPCDTDAAIDPAEGLWQSKVRLRCTV